MLTHIFRMARPTNFKLGIRTEDDDPHQPQARSQGHGRKVTWSVWAVLAECWHVSLEPGGSIPCRPNPVAALLVFLNARIQQTVTTCYLCLGIYSIIIIIIDYCWWSKWVRVSVILNCIITVCLVCRNEIWSYVVSWASWENRETCCGDSDVDISFPSSQSLVTLTQVSHLCLLPCIALSLNVTWLYTWQQSSTELHAKLVEFVNILTTHYNCRATDRYTAIRWLVHWPLMGGLLRLVQ